MCLLKSLLAFTSNQEFFNKIIFVMKVDNASKNPFIIYTLYLTLKFEFVFKQFLRGVNDYSIWL